MDYQLEEVHISTIRGGDTILHDEKVTTVSNSSISRIAGMGVCLFGDSYRLGYKPVKKLNLSRGY